MPAAARLTRELDEATQESVLRWIQGEAKRGTDEIGFVPRAGYVRHSRIGRLAVLHRAGEPVAFCMFGGRKPITQIFQLWCRSDARRVENGRALVAFIERVATDRGSPLMRARVAADLPAMSFWEAIGFSPKEIGPGGARRGRLIVTFHRDPIRLPPLLLRAPP